MDLIIYLFSANPGSDFSYYTEITAFAIALIVIGVFIKFISLKNKAFRKTYKSNTGNLFSLAGITLVLLGARYESVPFISMRFLLGITLIISAAFIIKLIVKYKKEFLPLNQKMQSPKSKTKKKTYSHSKKSK